MKTRTSIDTGYPQGTKTSFFVSAVAVCVEHGFVYCILGNCPNVFSTSKVTFGLLDNLLSTSS
jgi:hypothetical protein